ncbi:MAG: hypothetical protein V7K88_22865 [Nostoc sp.]|uniref:hypothetical protein n=1 Tax=Nostoc sp. TaxID=1180 RepID=UPI002FFBE659
MPNTTLGEAAPTAYLDFATTLGEAAPTTPLSTSAPCPIPLNPLQWICDVSLEIDIPAEWLRRSFHCL